MTEQQQKQLEKNEHEVKQAVPVELFNKYREAYLRERLKEMNVKDHEINAAMKFINERVDENDSNLNDVLDELKVRMRLDKRPKKLPYVDPSPMNWPNAPWTKPIDRGDIGKQIFDRLRKLHKI